MAKAEVWKGILGYEGVYQASTAGRIRSLDRSIATKTGNRKYPGRVLTPTFSREGYFYVDLSVAGNKDRRSVHRLVFETFEGVIPNDLQIRHLDGDQKNNNLSNLLLGTAKENAADRLRHGKGLRGSKHPKSKLREFQIPQILSDPRTHAEIAASFGVSKSLIANIKSGRAWKHMKNAEKTD